MQTLDGTCCAHQRKLAPRAQAPGSAVMSLIQIERGASDWATVFSEQRRTSAPPADIRTATDAYIQLVFVLRLRGRVPVGVDRGEEEEKMRWKITDHLSLRLGENAALPRREDARHDVVVQYPGEY